MPSTGWLMPDGDLLGQNWRRRRLRGVD
jgi:hypothetical protein